MNLFDCHVHLGPSDSGELYYGHLTMPELLRLMDQAGVTRSLVFPPYRLSGYAAANRELADSCATTAGRVRALARVGGRRIAITEPHLWLLRRQLRRLVFPPPVDLEIADLPRFAGIKLLPHLDGIPTAAVFEACNELGLPVLTHAGRWVTPRWIERVILPRVQTRLILAHLGGFPDREHDLRAAIDLAARDPRVYLDTSGVWIASFLRAAVERVPRKLIFGSDCPLATPAVAWKMVSSVVTDAGLQNRIGWEAGVEVFGS